MKQNKKLQFYLVWGFLTGGPWTLKGSIDVNLAVHGDAEFKMLKKYYIYIKNCVFLREEGPVVILHT